MKTKTGAGNRHLACVTRTSLRQCFSILLDETKQKLNEMSAGNLIY